MAPEIVLRQEYFGKPADIWAAGILLYALLHGYFPFKGKDDEELFSNIKSGEFRLQSSLSSEVQSLIQRMLSSNANERITAQEVLDHKWLCN